MTTATVSTRTATPSTIERLRAEAQARIARNRAELARDEQLLAELEAAERGR